MIDGIRQVRTGLLVLALLSGFSGGAFAQGVTGAAVQGPVAQIDNSRVEGARVELKSTQSGQTYTATTGTNGRYFIDNVQPGFGYTLTVTAIGFRPTTRAGLVLALGQRLTLDVGLASEAVQLEELQVTAVTDPLINANRTGP
jgi:hypothetical protein